MIFVNDREVKFTTYPNGEAVVPEIPKGLNGTYLGRLRWSGDHDLLQLALVNGLLAQHNARYTVLTSDYMPYSRMDREQDGHCFSLKYVSEIIAAMCWNKVYVVEPHSDVTLKLLGAEPIWATARLTPKAMSWMGFDKEHDYLVLPDAGAYKRYSELVPELDECHVVVLKKRRNFETGKITGLEVGYTLNRGGYEPNVTPKKALIIDDLSSRGGTFVQAAELLRAQLNFTEVALLVTHMEPAGLIGDLPKALDRVFCPETMTFPRPVPSNFEVFSRSDWL